MTDHSRPKVAIIVSPNWRDYAEKYLADCLASLRSQDYLGPTKLWLIDNETSAESYDFLRQAAPEAEIIANAANDGFAKGNNDALKLALEQGYDYCWLVNMDTISESHCLSALVEAAEAWPQAGAVQARLMLWPEQAKINSLGNITHYLGFGYSGHYLESYQPSVETQPQKINYPSGAGVLLSVAALRQVGLFDEEMWMYNEDQDLGWRLWLAGYICYLAPRAVIYHKYSFSRSIAKYYWMDRNRLLAAWKNYHCLTLLLLLPAGLLMELGLLLTAARGGWLKEKLKVYAYFFHLKTWRYLFTARRASQRLRRCPDREIIKNFSGRILFQEVDSPLVRLGNIFFNAYWQIVKHLIFW